MSAIELALISAIFLIPNLLFLGGKPALAGKSRQGSSLGGYFLAKELYITALPLLLVANHALHPCVG